MKKLFSLFVVFALAIPILRAQMDEDAPTKPGAATAPDEPLMPGQPKIVVHAYAPLVVPSTLELVKNVPMGQGGDRQIYADLLQPKTPPAKAMPAIIVIHGGGWKGGSYHRINAALSLARAGFFIASIEYRLSGEAVWPAQIEDCKLAVRWLRANAAKYHVDPDRIGVWGASAGGHLVAFLGVTGDLPQFEGKGGYPGVSSKVQAVADFSGPTDFLEGSEGIEGAKEGKDAEIMLKFFGGPFTEKADLYKQASPIAYVKAGDPPFLVVHGDADKTVPYTQSTKFVAALQKAGVPVQFMTIHGGGHNLRAYAGTPPATPDPAAFAKALVDFFNANLKK